MVRSLSFFSFFLLIVELSYGALPSQVYWNTMLPNTPIPSAITELLNHGELNEEKGASVGVGKGGVRVGVGVGVGPGTSVGVNVNQFGFNYQYGPMDDQLKTDPNITLFFLEGHLKSGERMNIYFTKTTSVTAFLPRIVVDSIPFSSTKLPQILARLSIQPDSNTSQTISNTIKECEEPAAKGEVKYCATSLESMIDFSISTLESRDLIVTSTTIDEESTREHRYTISSSVHTLGGEKVLACHAQPYAYAVFLCHLSRDTKAYSVPMIGEDGANVEAAAVCHMDTSSWNPHHLAFKVLNVKPGSVPVCHFLPLDHVIWTVKS